MVQNSHICFREDWELYPELKKIDAQYLSLVQFKTKKKKGNKITCQCNGIRAENFGNKAKD